MKLWVGLFTIILTTLVSFNTLAEQSPRVLFDQAHGQLFFIDRDNALDLSVLANEFRQQDFVVESTLDPLTKSHLDGVDALIISGAFSSPSKAEIEVIQQFVNDGGKLVVLLHVGPLVAPLLDSLGVAVSRAVIHDTLNAINGRSNDFPVRLLAGHPLFSQITSFNLYGGWALQPKSRNTQVMAMTNPSAWLDMARDQNRGNNPQGRFPVVVRGEMGEGEFLIFGDDAVFQNQFIQGNNLTLARNLISWLIP